MVDASKGIGPAALPLAFPVRDAGPALGGPSFAPAGLAAPAGTLEPGGAGQEARPLGTAPGSKAESCPGAERARSTLTEEP